MDNDGNALLTGAIYFNTVATEMRVYTGSAWQAQAASPDTIAERSFSATAGQTSYTFTGGYRVGYTYVYVNGALLAAADITATDGTTITFTNALSLDDEVRILSYKAIGSVAIGDISGLQTALDAKVGGDATNNIGYLNIPQNSQSAAYTLVLGDAGKHIFHPSGDANARTYTIPANSSVAYPIGTAITFINMTSQVVTIAITTDTMYLSSAGTTGSRSLAQYGSATAIKMTSTTWLISGSGLT